MVAVIKICLETLFSKKLYYIETSQSICSAINWLVSVWYQFSLKAISEQTIVQFLFKYMLILKNKVILVPWKYLAVGLCYFTIHDPTIRDPTMHNSCANYSNMFKLCSENLNNIFYGTSDLVVVPQENTSYHDNTRNLAVLLRLMNTA